MMEQINFIRLDLCFQVERLLFLMDFQTLQTSREKVLYERLLIVIYYTSLVWQSESVAAEVATATRSGQQVNRL